MVVTVAAFLITVAFNDNNSLDDPLQALGISVVYSTQLVIKGRYKTAQDFDISTVKDLQSMVENVNKLSLEDEASELFIFHFSKFLNSEL